MARDVSMNTVTVWKYEETGFPALIEEVHEYIERQQQIFEDGGLPEVDVSTGAWASTLPRDRIGFVFERARECSAALVFGGAERVCTKMRHHERRGDNDHFDANTGDEWTTR